MEVQSYKETMIISPQSGTSPAARQSVAAIAQLQNWAAIPTSNHLEFLLQSKKFDLKIMVGHLACNLGPKWRESLFRQIDFMLESEDWHSDDLIPQDASMRTFLRLILFIQPSRLPSLALSNSGNLIGAWISEKDRLTIEFKADDNIRYVLSCWDEDNRRAVAGDDRVRSLLKSLSGFRPERWFEDGTISTNTR